MYNVADEAEGTPPEGAGGTWVFFWVVLCAARDLLAPRSKTNSLKLIPRSGIRPKTDTPF